MVSKLENKQKLYSFLEEYAVFFEEVAASEQEKLQSLLSSELKAIEHSIAVQQANAKRMDNFEAKRAELQKQAQLDGCTFLELIERAPEEYRAQLQVIYDRVNRAVSDIKYLNGKSMKVVEERRKQLEGQDAKAPAAYGHTGQGIGTAPASSLLQKKV